MELEKELETFYRELPRLLREGKEGRFALIHEDDFDSDWPTQDEALDAGYERFDLGSFMVKEIVGYEKPHYCSRNVRECR